MMYIILAYDVQSKRVGKVMKTVKKYIRPVQRSVFEGYITEGKLNRLKREIYGIVDPEKDSVVIYKCTGLGMPRKEVIGKTVDEEYFIL